MYSNFFYDILNHPLFHQRIRCKEKYVFRFSLCFDDRRIYCLSIREHVVKKNMYSDFLRFDGLPFIHYKIAFRSSVRISMIFAIVFRRIHRLSTREYVKKNIHDFLCVSTIDTSTVYLLNDCTPLFSSYFDDIFNRAISTISISTLAGIDFRNRPSVNSR